MPDVTVPVPDDRVAESYQFFGQRLGGSLSPSYGGHELLFDTSGDLGKRRGWTGLDEDRGMLRSSGPR